MMTSLVAISLVAMTFVLVQGQMLPAPTPSESYHHSVDLDERRNFFLFWRFDEDEIVFEVHARTHGWVGFGLADKGSMHGADLVIGWMRDGEPYFKDHHGIGTVKPVVDDEQNYELISAEETDEFTVFKFSRKLNTCDKHDYSIHGGTIRVLFAWNHEKPEGSDEAFQYHGATQRGVKSVLLLDKATEAVTMHEGENWTSFKFTQNKVPLPRKRTYYHCRIVALPVLDKKHHIVRIRPDIQPENVGVVHHIVAYMCAGNLKTEAFGEECWEDRMPENATECSKFLFGWAVGGGIFYLPDDAGIPIGPGYLSVLKLEMHYDNPLGLSDVVDSSGLVIDYTDKLRQHDLGVLITGHSIWWPRLVIPPRAQRFRLDSYCSASCTDNIPPEGVTVTSTFLHTHLVGSSLVVRHIRNGTELREIAKDEHYDFNYQEMRQVWPTKKLLPGDELITSCTYDTSAKDKPVYGGGGSDEEMCFAFIFYYPAMRVSSCLSQVQTYYGMHQLAMHRAMTGKLKVDLRNSSDETAYDYLNNINWEGRDVEHLQRQIDNTVGYRENCVVDDSEEGLFGGGGSTYQPVIKIERPLVHKDKCASTTSDVTISASSCLRHIGLLPVIMAAMLFM